jgi:hypothetical protein
MAPNQSNNRLPTRASNLSIRRDQRINAARRQPRQVRMENRTGMDTANPDLRESERAGRVEVRFNLKHFRASGPSLIRDLRVGSDHEDAADTARSRERKQSLNQQAASE